MTRDFNWVDYLPYVLGAAGWLILMVLAMVWLHHQMNRNDEKLRAKAAKELGKRLHHTSSGTEIFWAVDDPTPDEVLEVDPPVTKPYATGGYVEYDRRYFLDRWES